MASETQESQGVTAEEERTGDKESAKGSLLRTEAEKVVGLGAPS